MKISLVMLLLVVSSCTLSEDRVKKPQDYCDTNKDCACGRHTETNDCFFGNKDYVNTEEPCPDFCSGITGTMKLVCINNHCEQVHDR